MEFVLFIDTRKGKKLLKVFKSQRAANMFLNKNTDKILAQSGVESVGTMSKKEWDTKEAKYAIESVNEANEEGTIFQLRKIVKDKQNALIVDTTSKKKVRVDIQSANLMLQVYDALKKQSNKDKFIKSGIVNMGHMAYKLLKKESVNEDRNSNMFYVLYQKKGVFGKPTAAGYKDRKDAEKFAKSLGNNHNTMILDKQSMKNVKGVDVKESVNEAKEYKPKEVEKVLNQAVKQLQVIHKKGGDIQSLGKKQLNQFKKKFGLTNNDEINQLIDSFEDWLYDMRESVNEAKFGYKDSTASYITKHKDEYKQAEKMNKGNEMKFYDLLQQMEDKAGHGKTMLFISNSLRGYGVDMFKDPKIKNPQDAQEALFLLSK